MGVDFFVSIRLLGFNIIMGKMRKGKNHHWYKEGIDRNKKNEYVPTGKPRGRPPKAKGQKSQPYVPTGKPRGRPKSAKEETTNEPKSKTSKATTPTGKSRGRPRSNDEDIEKKEESKGYTPTGKPRGRPSKKSKQDSDEE